MGCLDSPTEGSYHLHGQDVSSLSDTQLAHIRNREIGFVFQQFNLLPRTTALRQVELPLMYAGHERSRAPQAGPGSAGSRRPGRPHGPQARRAVGRAAAAGGHRPGAGDRAQHHHGRRAHGQPGHQVGEEVLRIFQQLNEQGITIIFVTHDPEIAEYSRRTIHIRDGLIEKDEPYQSENGI